MVEVLDTASISGKLIEIIKNSSSKLIFIVPKLSLNEKIKELLVKKNNEKVQIYIVFSEDELPILENKWFDSMKNLHLLYSDNLRATYYMNEKELLVTTLSLKDIADMNGIDSGILLKKEKDRKLYSDHVKQISYIMNKSKELQITVETIDVKKPVVRKIKKKIPKSIIAKQKMAFNKDSDLNLKYTDEIKEDEIIDSSEQNVVNNG